MLRKREVTLRNFVVQSQTALYVILLRKVGNQGVKTEKWLVEALVKKEVWPGVHREERRLICDKSIPCPVLVTEQLVGFNFHIFERTVQLREVE